MHNTMVVEDETPRAAAQADAQAEAQKERHEEYVQKDVPAPLMHGSTRRTTERAGNGLYVLPAKQVQEDDPAMTEGVSQATNESSARRRWRGRALRGRGVW